MMRRGVIVHCGTVFRLAIPATSPPALRLKCQRKMESRRSPTVVAQHREMHHDITISPAAKELRLDSDRRIVLIVASSSSSSFSGGVKGNRDQAMATRTTTLMTTGSLRCITSHLRHPHRRRLHRLHLRKQSTKDNDQMLPTMTTTRVAFT
jgi:hypothetical protein